MYGSRSFPPFLFFAGFENELKRSTSQFQMAIRVAFKINDGIKLWVLIESYIDIVVLKVAIKSES